MKGASPRAAARGVFAMRRRIPKSRVLLIAVVAVLTGGGLYVAQRAHEETSAIQTIQHFGGYVVYRQSNASLWNTWTQRLGYWSHGSAEMVDFDPDPEGPQATRRDMPNILQSLNQLNTIEALSLNKLPLRNRDLIHLKSLSKLKRLNLEWTETGDDGLSCLGERCELKELYIGNTRVTDEGLRHLKQFPNLEILILDGTQVSDDGLRHLTQLKKLKELSVSNTDVSEEGVHWLSEQMPGLTVSDD